jgi:hypothetical protein
VTAGGYGAKLTPLHRGVEAAIGKVSRGKVQSEAGELGKDGRIWFDITSDKYYLAGIEPEEPEDDTEPRLSVQIVDLLMETYRVGRSTDGKPFIVGKGSHVVTAVATRRFKEHIVSLSWSQFRTPAPKGIVEEVASVITGMAFSEDPVEVWHRVAPLERHGVVIDLGQTSEKVIVANALGWTVEVKSPGPLFIRTELTAAMATPQAGASSDELWNVIRVAEDRRGTGWVPSNTQVRDSWFAGHLYTVPRKPSPSALVKISVSVRRCRPGERTPRAGGLWKTDLTGNGSRRRRS